MGSQPDSQSLELIARLCYFANGVTKVLHGMPFRAAACTGALYHIELYVICADLEDGLEAGVYHYGAHDNALRRLRSGDFRFTDAPLNIVLTSTWWRNAWKYQSRAYRHAFWDGGTLLANLLAVGAAQAQPCEVVLAFPDSEVNRVLDVDAEKEAAIALVSIGNNDVPSPKPDVQPLNLPTRRLSAHEIDYPLIVQAHTESSLPSWDAAREWRAQFSRQPAASWTIPRIEEVILRRGSSRRFTHDPITFDQFNTLLQAATSPTPMDAFVACELYLIANAVDGLQSGTYVVDRENKQPVLLRQGEFRREASFLDLGQQLAGDAALNVYWLIDLEMLDDRGYRAAQLSAAIEAGKLYLAAYAQDLGATGLTFFDDEVTSFFSPHAAGKSVMFLTAVGHAARRGAGG